MEPIYDIRKPWTVTLCSTHSVQKCERCEGDVEGGMHYRLSLNPHMARTFCMNCPPKRSDITNDPIYSEVYRVQETLEDLADGAGIDKRSVSWLAQYAASVAMDAEPLVIRLEESELTRHQGKAEEICKWIAHLRGASETISRLGDLTDNDARSLLADVLLPASRNLELEHDVCTWA